MVQERDRLRLAIIGCGQIGRLHAERIIADGRGRIVALCDPVAAAAERFREVFAPGARIANRPEDLPDDGSLDAVVVCTPTHLHFDQVRLFRGRGLAVLCEKPLADTRERIVQLIAETRAGGPLVSVAYQRRCWSTFRTLRREILSGKHGPIRSVTTHNAERWAQTIEGTWRNDLHSNPGGFIGDAGSHKIDMVFYVTGLAPREVFAHSDRHEWDVEIATTISARLEGNVALGMHFIGDAQHYREDFHVHCEHADLLFRDDEVRIAHDNRVEKITPLERESNPNAAFLDCLLQGDENFAPPAVALPVWDFTQGVLESARTGQVVRLGKPRAP